MTIGKLTLCLSILEGIEPQKRAIKEAVATATPDKESIIFVGFPSVCRPEIKDYLPIPYQDKFFLGNIENDKETFHLIFNSSTKAVVFNHLYDHQHKKDRLELILQLLNSGINVFTTASLKYFELCKKELKDIAHIQNDAFLVPASFFKYIQRVILINNLDELEQTDVYCPLKAELAANPSKKVTTRLEKLSFILATHIHHHSRNFFIENKNTSYVNSPSTLQPILTQILQKTVGITSGFYAKLKRQSYHIASSVMNVLIIFLGAQIFLPNVLSSNTSWMFLLGGVALINLVSYSFLPALISLLFAALLNLSTKTLCLYHPRFFLENLGLFLGVSLIYIIMQNRRIIFKQRQKLDEKETRFKFLYRYTETLASANTIQEIFHISEEYFKSAFNLEIILILQDPNTLKPKQIFTPTFNKFINDSENDESIQRFDLSEYSDYELTHLVEDSIEFGWLGIKKSILGIESDKTSLNSTILQLTIALQRYNLSKSYQSVVLNSEKEQLRSVILSSISHDLKTPLTTIIGSCTALEELENLSEKQRMILVHTIHEASEQLNQFISNILDSSRLSTENILQQTSLVFLDDVINVVLHRSRKITRLFDVSVTVVDSEKAAIYGDFTLIQQVLYNVIENATKYSPIGARISINVNNIMDKVFIRIIDNGPGIIESKRSMIFDKFYRFQHTDQQKAGTGLGLSICKQIVDAYHGKIWVSDRDDGLKGSQFNIELPCAFPTKQTNTKTKVDILK